MKELTAASLLINNIIIVDNVVRMGIWVARWSGKEAKSTLYIHICVHSEIYLNSLNFWANIEQILTLSERKKLVNLVRKNYW